MNTILQKSAIIIILVLLSFSSCTKDSNVGDKPTIIDSLLVNTKIVLQVYNFENTNGAIAIAIYNSSSSFNSETVFYQDTAVAVTATAMEIEIDNMQAGTYAISILHDENENGEMEMGGFLNLIPQEGFGFSNNPSIVISEPTFEQCDFVVDLGQSVSVPITLVYM